MFYVITVQGWPVLVWLAVQPPPRCEVLWVTDDMLSAVASFRHALEALRRRLPSAYRAPGENTMSPSPPDAMNRPTYDSVR